MLLSTCYVVAPQVKKAACIILEASGKSIPNLLLPQSVYQEHVREGRERECGGREGKREADRSAVAPWRPQVD